MREAEGLCFSDADGGEPWAASTRSSRTHVVGTAIIAGGAVLAGGALAMPDSSAAGRPSLARDVDVLNFLLVLEYLQASFYVEARTRAKLRGELLEFANVVHAHEQEHVAFLKRMLGRYARRKPRFDFRDTTAVPKKFAATAALLEETAVAAYNGQGTNLTKGALANATEVVSVEARHAAWIRDIIGESPAPRAADPPKTAVQVTALLRRNQFLK